MTIDEAIKRMSQRVAWLAQWKAPEDLEDMKLGIEALQFFKGAQREAGGYQELRLSGETEE